MQAWRRMAQGGGLCGPKDHYTSNLAPKPIATMRAASSVDGNAAGAQASLMPPAGAGWSAGCADWSRVAAPREMTQGGSTYGTEGGWEKGGVSGKTGD
jgi:hypothetical protein